MPLYDFACKTCDERQEVLQRYEDKAPTCASCAKPMARQVGATSFKLEGYSWGKNGYSNRPPWDVARATKD